MIAQPPPRLAALVYRGRSCIHGTGLFARVDLQRGTFIGSYLGPPARRNGPYVLWVTAEDGSISARSGRNLLRYLNHQRPANAHFDGFDLYVRRRIRAGEEITIDYGWEAPPE